MRAIAIRPDGRNGSRIEALTVPSPVLGPGATGTEDAGTPIGDSALSVSLSRLHPQEEEAPGPSMRCLRFVLDGQLHLTASGEKVHLGRGDVVLVDDLSASGHQVSTPTGATLLNVEIDDRWVASGTVPPPVAVTPSSPKVLRLYVEDGLAHLEDLAGFDRDDAPLQRVEKLNFLCLTDGVASDWHTEEGISLLIVLAGGFELEPSGKGGRQVLRAGDVCLVDDRRGKGHITRTHGETRFVAIRLPEDHLWRRDAAL